MRSKLLNKIAIGSCCAGGLLLSLLLTDQFAQGGYSCPPRWDECRDPDPSNPDWCPPHCDSCTGTETLYTGTIPRSIQSPGPCSSVSIGYIDCYTTGACDWSDEIDDLSCQLDNGTKYCRSQMFQTCKECAAPNNPTTVTEIDYGCTNCGGG